METDFARLGEPAIGERRAHPRDVLIETSLRDQHGSHEAKQQVSEQDVPQRGLDQESDRSGNDQKQDDDRDASRFSLRRRPCLAIERAVEKSDGGTDQGHRMR